MGDFKAFHTTTTGISHSKNGKECQDYSGHYTSADMTVAVVADGHGSEDCFRSAKGAKFAMECALQGIADFVKYLDGSEEKSSFFQKPLPRKVVLGREEIEKCLKERLLAKGIIAAWYLKVADDVAQFHPTEGELAACGEKYRKRYENSKNVYHAYGTTLIAAAITDEYWFGFHIGDGRLTALYRDGSFEQPVPWDERCYLNITTSVCDDDAGETARVWFCSRKEKELPFAVFLCSDGIDDNYPVDGNERYLFELYRTIVLTFADDGFESTCKQLDDLAVSFATKGKGDDTSLAGFIDMAALKQIADKYRKQEEPEEDEVRGEDEKTEKELPCEIDNSTEIREVIIQKALDAINEKNAATEITPMLRSQAELYFRGGKRHFNNRKYSLAIAAFDSSIGLDPSCAKAYVGRGLAYSCKRKEKEAIADLEKFLTMDIPPELAKIAEKLLQELRRK